MDIKQKLKDLPAEAGVYIMTDSDGVIIYIGKAKVLKNRVRSYFSGKKTEKVTQLMHRVADFRYIICKNEIDAFILEANLIKKHKPFYNILLKDDKHYPYIKIDLTQKFPKFEIVRKLKKGGDKYFGPYLGISVIDLSTLICEIFPLRNCNNNLDKLRKNHRPCLNYELKKCLAPCKAKTTEEEYGKVVKELISFLKGNTDYAEEFLTKKMEAASAREDFEEAIYYRDCFKILDKLRYKKVAALKSDVSLDVLAYASDGIQCAVSLLMLRNGKILGSESFQLGSPVSEGGEAISSFISQYYRTHEVPPEIVVNLLDDRESLSDFLRHLRGKTVQLTEPKMGIKKELVDMAYINACDFVEKSREYASRKQDMTRGAVARLKTALNLQKAPRRIECYDISNIMGVDKVASMVVFVDGEKERNEYRRFKIKTVSGANDFASMAETLSRRFARLKEESEDENENSFSTTPDLIVLDGGKGQLSAGTEAAIQAGFGDIEMIALAEKHEHVYTRYSPDPVILDKNSVELKLLIRLRDEAHRFAVSYFRSLHGKNSLLSELDNIDGVGKTLKQALIKHFKNVSKIKAATMDELKEIERMPAKTAENIIKYFTGAEKEEDKVDE